MAFAPPSKDRTSLRAGRRQGQGGRAQTDRSAQFLLIVGSKVPSPFASTPMVTCDEVVNVSSPLIVTWILLPPAPARLSTPAWGKFRLSAVSVTQAVVVETFTEPPIFVLA